MQSIRISIVNCMSALAFFLGCTGVSSATTYYLDPATGSLDKPGTSDAPWGSLESVASSDRVFGAGDILILRAGHHGAPVLTWQNAGVVTVRAEHGPRPQVRQLTLRNARNWHVSGLLVTPEFEQPYIKVGTLIDISGGADNVVEDCVAYSVQDNVAWTSADWETLACNGAALGGTRNVLRRCSFRNVNFGISTGGSSSHCVVDGNTVDRFASDGLRGLGDFSVFEYNVVKNCFGVNTNHDDGFQSWSTGSGGVGTGVVRGIVLRGNTFIDQEDPKQPDPGYMQGIGCFDGFFEDWIVENNIIVTDAWHGIAFYGARNCRIVNNTVIDRSAAKRPVPWLIVTAHKNGSASVGNVVRNNLVSDLKVDAGTATLDHNVETTSYAVFFRDWTGLDLQLAAGSPAIDAGSSEGAPWIDIIGAVRPVDGNGDGLARVDLGAYEATGDESSTPEAPSGLMLR